MSPMTADARRHAQAGFTLVELLVALAVTALITGFILGGFDLSRRAWAISRDRAGAEEVDAGMMRLRDLLTRTMPAATIDESDRIARVLFEGHPDSLTFVTLSEANAFPGGPMRVRLAWSDGAPATPGARALILRTAVFRANPRLVVDAEPVILVRDVVGLSLRYFGVADIGKPPQWLTDWPGRLGTPRLVFVEVDVADKGGTRHLVLQVPIRITGAG